MLIITPAASEALGSISHSSEIPPAGGVRLSFVPGRDGRPGLSMTIVAEPEPEDDVMDASDVSLFLQPQAAAILDDKVLDVQSDGDGQPSFVLAMQMPGSP